MHDWWRQAKIQAGTSRTPVLVITQSYRPFYFILRKTDWDGMREMTEYDLFGEEIPMKKIKTLMDDLADLERYKVGSMTLDDDEVILIPQDFYVSVKESLYWLGRVDGSNSKSYNKDR